MALTDTITAMLDKGENHAPDDNFYPSSGLVSDVVGDKNTGIIQHHLTNIPAFDSHNANHKNVAIENKNVSSHDATHSYRIPSDTRVHETDHSSNPSVMNALPRTVRIVASENILASNLFEPINPFQEGDLSTPTVVEIPASVKSTNNINISDIEPPRRGMEDDIKQDDATVSTRNSIRIHEEQNVHTTGLNTSNTVSTTDNNGVSGLYRSHTINKHMDAIPLEVLDVNDTKTMPRLDQETPSRLDGDPIHKGTADFNPEHTIQPGYSAGATRNSTGTVPPPSTSFGYQAEPFARLNSRGDVEYSADDTWPELTAVNSAGGASSSEDHSDPVLKRALAAIQHNLAITDEQRGKLWNA